MNRLRLFIPLFIFVGFAGLLLLSLLLNKDKDPSELPSALIGKPMPQFALGTVYNSQDIKTQEDVKGNRFALVNVWATWCPPCRQEHPYLVELSERGVPIYGVNLDEASDMELVHKWLANYGDPFQFSVSDSQRRLAIDLGVYGYPETFLIDADGKVLLRNVGIMSEQVWQDKFQPIIDTLSPR